MGSSDANLIRIVCGMKLVNGGRCQNPVKPGKGPCWRHAIGFLRKIQSLARNETKKFVITTALGLLAVAGAFYGGSRIMIAHTTGPNSPAVNGDGTTINYGTTPPPRPWVAIKVPKLANTIEISDRGLDAGVLLPLENTSETPAVAAVGASLFFITEQHPEAGIRKAQDDLCKSIQDRMETEKIISTTVFRGTEQYHMTVGVHADRKEVDEASRLMTLNFLPPRWEPEIDPLIISCVAYRATTGKDYYSSAYANQIGRLVCKTPTSTVCNVGAILAKKKVYKPSDLVFPPSFDSPIRAK